MNDFSTFSIARIHEHAVFDRGFIDCKMIETPYGQATLGVTDRGVCWLGLGDNTDMIAERFGVTPHKNDDLKFSDVINLDLYGTPFQIAVWKALLNVQSGETKTYSHVAHMIGKPNAIRAAASAVAKNPVSLIIPCHRIIRMDGSTGKYLWGSDVKRNILAGERT